MCGFLLIASIFICDIMAAPQVYNEQINNSTLNFNTSPNVQQQPIPQPQPLMGLNQMNYGYGGFNPMFGGVPNVIMGGQGGVNPLGTYPIAMLNGANYGHVQNMYGSNMYGNNMYGQQNNLNANMNPNQNNMNGNQNNMNGNQNNMNGNQNNMIPNTIANMNSGVNNNGGQVEGKQDVVYDEANVKSAHEFQAASSQSQIHKNKQKHTHHVISVTNETDKFESLIKLLSGMKPSIDIDVMIVTKDENRCIMIRNKLWTKMPHNMSRITVDYEDNLLNIVQHNVIFYDLSACATSFGELCYGSNSVSLVKGWTEGNILQRFAQCLGWHFEEIKV